MFEQLQQAIKLTGVRGQVAANFVEAGNQRRNATRGRFTEQAIDSVADRLPARQQGTRFREQRCRLGGCLFGVRKSGVPPLNVLWRQQFAKLGGDLVGLAAGCLQVCQDLCQMLPILVVEHLIGADQEIPRLAKRGRSDRGFVTIQGRIKEMIRRAGENISATEIEAALVEVEAEDLVGVVGVVAVRLQAAKTEQDPEKSRQMYTQLEDMQLDDVVMIPIVYQADVLGANLGLAGVDLTPWDATTWNIKDWRRVTP